MKYKFHTKPYKHQVRALRKLISNGYGGALLMEPRTGKTKVAIDFASMLSLKGRIDKVLIVAPNRVLDVWVEQFHLHCSLSYNITVWDNAARKKRGVGYTPPPKARSAFDLNVVIVNYEAFGTPGRRTKSGRRSKASGRYKIRAILRSWMNSTSKKTLMILDESHRIANPSGSAANMIVTMQGDARYKVIMTGTPVTKAKKAHDIQMQWRFLNPDRFSDIPTVDEFKNTFGRWIHENGYPQWIGPRNRALLQERIHEDAIVVRRDDCFDLPPRDTQIVRVPLTNSGPVYDEMAREMVAKIIKAKEEHTIEASIRLVQGLRLRQITGGVGTTDEKRLIRIGSEKLRALAPILEAQLEHEEKIVIACQFRPDLAAVYKLAAGMGARTFLLKGGVSRDQATSDIRAFQRHDGCAVYVIQPQSGAEGIDLSTAPHMLWYSLTPSFVKWTQMNDRIALSRISTTFTYLLAKNTIDEVLYETLLTDGDVTRAILDKPERLLRAP